MANKCHKHILLSKYCFYEDLYKNLDHVCNFFVRFYIKLYLLVYSFELPDKYDWLRRKNLYFENKNVLDLRFNLIEIFEFANEAKFCVAEKANLDFLCMSAIVSACMKSNKHNRCNWTTLK